MSRTSWCLNSRSTWKPSRRPPSCAGLAQHRPWWRAERLVSCGGRAARRTRTRRSWRSPCHHGVVARAVHHRLQQRTSADSSFLPSGKPLAPQRAPSGPGSSSFCSRRCTRRSWRSPCWRRTSCTRGTPRRQRAPRPSRARRASGRPSSAAASDVGVWSVACSAQMHSPKRPSRRAPCTTSLNICIIFSRASAALGLEPDHRRLRIFSTPTCRAQPLRQVALVERLEHVRRSAVLRARVGRARRASGERPFAADRRCTLTAGRGAFRKRVIARSAFVLELLVARPLVAGAQLAVDVTARRARRRRRPLMKPPNPPSASATLSSSCDSKRRRAARRAALLNPSSSVTRFFSRSTSPTISAPTFNYVLDHAVARHVAVVAGRARTGGTSA